MFSRIVVAILVLLTSLPVTGKAPVPKSQPKVTLCVTKIQATDNDSRDVVNNRCLCVACDLVLENMTGEDLTAESCFYSAFDEFELVFFKDGKELTVCRHSWKYSSMNDKKKYTLKQGKNEDHLRFDVRLKPDVEWEKLEVKLRGTLRECKFKDELS
jgi:hypothetical protein